MQFATYNKLTCEKEFLFYPEFAHEQLEGYEDFVFRFPTQL
ncbi:MAG: acetylxylan esterase [Clostridia bacterium]|nr:acetylxylan esterase [Clostridia bacterium]